jgi:hypothetical protein
VTAAELLPAAIVALGASAVFVALLAARLARPLREPASSAPAAGPANQGVPELVLFEFGDWRLSPISENAADAALTPAAARRRGRTRSSDRVRPHPFPAGDLRP